MSDDPAGASTDPPANMARLEALVARLPEAVRVDVEAWDNHPTFRVRNKNFVFASHDGHPPLVQAVDRGGRGRRPKTLARQVEVAEFAADPAATGH